MAEQLIWGQCEQCEWGRKCWKSCFSVSEWALCVKSFTFAFTNAFVLKANLKEMLYMILRVWVLTDCDEKRRYTDNVSPSYCLCENIQRQTHSATTVVWFIPDSFESSDVIHLNIWLTCSTHDSCCNSFVINVVILKSLNHINATVTLNCASLKHWKCY